MASSSTWQTTPTRGVAATIDHIGKDLLQNIVARLLTFSFASAACVSRSWNLVCDRVLCRSKLSSACSFSSSLKVVVEDMLNKVLSEPIHPHFAISSVGPSFDLHQITAKLGSKLPVIANVPFGIMGRDAFSDEFKEWEITEEDDDPGVPLLLYGSANRAIMVIFGFLPGLKAKVIPLLKQIEEPLVVMIDKFGKKYNNITFLFYCMLLVVVVVLMHHYVYRRRELLLAIPGKDLMRYWKLLLPFSFAIVSGAI